MLYLKEANLLDLEEEYKANCQMPFRENGFENIYCGMSLQQYRDIALRQMMNEAKGIGLSEDWVACTYFFLWDDDTIVGLFKIRHYLNDRLREGAGHIGYGILKQYRKRGYGTAGLRLALDKCKEIVEEDVVYMSAYLDNLASIKVMLNNGAWIEKVEDGTVYTRVKIR